MIGTQAVGCIRLGLSNIHGAIFSPAMPRHLPDKNPPEPERIRTETSGNAVPRQELTRRDFLRAIAMGGAFTSAGGTFAAAEVGKPALVRRFKVKSFELDEMSIAGLQAGMRSGKYTSVALVNKYLTRIGQIDRRGPAINAVIEINPDALAIARSLDQERKTNGARGPLHGIPVLIKDNIDTHDRMMTTAGSLALTGWIPSRDSFVAHQLREAGAVILGKTNLSEWANFRSTHSTSGWSARGGLTRNPYALDRNTSGSSSGSGAAVAANLCAVAVGTETDGSIVSPSSVNEIGRASCRERVENSGVVVMLRRRQE